MAEGLEALLRSAQAALSAASQRRYPPPKSGAQKLRRSSRWRSLEQGLWRTDRCRCGRAAPEAVAALADGARRCVRVPNTRTRKRGFLRHLRESEDKNCASVVPHSAPDRVELLPKDLLKRTATPRQLHICSHDDQRRNAKEGLDRPYHGLFERFHEPPEFRRDTAEHPCGVQQHGAKLRKLSVVEGLGEDAETLHVAGYQNCYAPAVYRRFR
jgi:hypothetical protein